MNIILLLSLTLSSAQAQAKGEPTLQAWWQWSGGVATPASAPALGGDFAGLKAGSSKDWRERRRVLRVKKALKLWNARLELAMDGDYKDDLVAALVLFKAIYGVGVDGTSIDAKTAELLEARERSVAQFHAAVERLPRRGRKTPAQATLYNASRKLRLPYVMGGDGTTSTDCGMLTRLALIEAGVVGEDFTRAADYQFRESLRKGVALVGFLKGQSKPRPGDLVFFQNTYDAGPTFDGITHVGLYVGETGGDRPLVLEAASSGVALHPSYYAPYAYARPVERKAVAAAERTLVASRP
jgi:cell wall-associated NlpC family hydrolase